MSALMVAEDAVLPRAEVVVRMLRAVACARQAEMPSDGTLSFYEQQLALFALWDVAGGLLRVARAELQPWEPRFPELGLVLRAVREQAEARHLEEDGARWRAAWDAQTRLRLEEGTAWQA